MPAPFTTLPYSTVVVQVAVFSTRGTITTFVLHIESPENAMNITNSRNYIFLLGFAMSLPALGQTIDPRAKPKPGHRLEMRPGPLVASPAHQTKEPGDDVVVRPDGVIVATPRSRSFHFLPTNRVAPAVNVSYTSANGRVVYQYQISNGAGAQAIGAFELAVGVPVDIDTPEPWRALKVQRSNAQPFLGFLRVVRDGEERGRLSGGIRLDPIRLTSDFAPGLIETTFHGEPQSAASMLQAHGMTAGEFLNAASPWVQQRLAELDTQDRHRLRTLTIGPVAPLSADPVLAVRAEIERATQWPQLSTLRDHALKSSAPAEKTALIAWLSNVRSASEPGLVTEFIAAMHWRLQHPVSQSQHGSR
jgi:hypothetical protein